MKRFLMVHAGLVVVLAAGLGMAKWTGVWMGRQPDGSFLVSTGQRIEGGFIAFKGRPIDLALHPTRDFLAVLNKDHVFLMSAEGAKTGTEVALGSNAGFRGLIWTPGGERLLASTEEGHIQTFRLSGETLQSDAKIKLAPEGQSANPVPGGMAITRDGSRLFVAAANRNAVVEVDLARNVRIREYPVQNLPFEPRLTDDESMLVVSNWAGRPAQKGERTAKSQNLDVLVDEHGAAASGSVSLIDLKSGMTRHVEVGIHPTAIAVAGKRAYIANAMSDSISEIDLASASVTRMISLRWGRSGCWVECPMRWPSRGRPCTSPTAATMPLPRWIWRPERSGDTAPLVSSR